MASIERVRTSLISVFAYLTAHVFWAVISGACCCFDIPINTFVSSTAVDAATTALILSRSQKSF